MLPLNKSLVLVASAMLLLPPPSALAFAPHFTAVRTRTSSRLYESQANSTVDELDPLATAEFGQVVSMRKPSSSAVDDSILCAPRTTTTSPAEQAAQMRRRNIVVAVASICLALGNYLWQFTHPLTPVQLLSEMQQSSAPLSIIGSNAKPTLVDFWAPWCENCKAAAPTLQAIEAEYKDKVNFVLINGDKTEAWPAIEAFGVDAIPHMALVDANGDVETALIGPIPKHILKADLDALIEQTQGRTLELPFKMLDAFASRPNQRRVHFDP